MFFCSILFAADAERSVHLRPGINEITVKILNECEKDIKNIRLFLNKSDIPEGIYITMDSSIVNSMKGSIVSIPLKVNVSNCVKEGVYNVSLILRDNQNHSWNYSLALEVENAVLEEYILAQNYPNPFNLTTTIQYSIPHDKENVKIEIYDITGKKIKTLVDQEQNSGNYSIHWDGKNDHNVLVSSGVYIYQLKAGSFTNSKRMILLK